MFQRSLPAVHQATQAVLELRDLLQVVLDRAQDLLQPRGPQRLLVPTHQPVVLREGLGVPRLQERTRDVEALRQLPGFRRQWRRDREGAVVEHQDRRTGLGAHRRGGREGLAGRLVPGRQQAGKALHEGDLLQVGLPFLLDRHGAPPLQADASGPGPRSAGLARRLVARHEESLDDLPPDDVPLHDLGHVRLAADPVPDAFGIDDHARAVLAVVEAAGLVRADRALESQPLDFLLEEGLQALRALVRAAAARVVLGTLVNADEDMVRVGGHEGQRGDAADSARAWTRPSRAATSAGSRRRHASRLPSRIARISRSRSCARWTWSAASSTEGWAEASLSNSPRMSRKSRCRFLCIEQLSQYHLRLWSAEGESRSYARPKKSLPSESFIRGPRSVPQASHRMTEPA